LRGFSQSYLDFFIPPIDETGGLTIPPISLILTQNQNNDHQQGRKEVNLYLGSYSAAISQDILKFLFLVDLSFPI